MTDQMTGATQMTAIEESAASKRIASALVDRQVVWDREYAQRHGHQPSDDESAVWMEAELQSELRKLAAERLRSGAAELWFEAEEKLARAIRLRISPMQLIMEMLGDPLVENIFMTVDRTWIVKRGRVKEAGPRVFETEEEMRAFVQRLGATGGRSERRFDASTPTLDVELPGGHRFNAVMAVTEGVTVSIRRHGHIEVSLDDLVSYGTLDRSMADFLAAVTRPPFPGNIIVAGGTNAGKTTMLRALVDEVAAAMPDTRLITIEDQAELRFDAHRSLSDVVTMEARPANTEGEGEFTVAQCIRNALRMSPERLIVGEVRGAEAVDMLNAMSIGNDGSMSTIHAYSARFVMDRLVMYGHIGGFPEEATLHATRGAIQLIVHLAMLLNGKRVVTEILEVTGDSTDDGGVATNQLWRPGPDGSAVRTGAMPSERLAKIVEASGFDMGGSW